MAVSATIINENELGIELPTRLIDIPVSFQRIFRDYWEPIIDRLGLTTLRYIGFIEIDFSMWPVFKDELLQVQRFVNENPNVIEVELRKDPSDTWVAEYIVGRINHLIKSIQDAYDLSDKVIYYL